MSEKPILFSAPMVRAILEGRKTMTRRAFKPIGPTDEWASAVSPVDGAAALFHASHGYRDGRWAKGDLLWIQEGHQIIDRFTTNVGTSICVEYAADKQRRIVALTEGETAKLNARRSSIFRSQPGRFLYKSAARIWLEVTGARVERLHDITDADAKAEGVSPAPFAKASRPPTDSHVEAFEDLWRTINGAESWDANPWVWVVSFKRTERKVVAA